MRRADAGVTMIEILVVLTLIAISAGIVSYALPSAAPTRTVQQEATLLAARLNLAAERSLMNGRHYMLDWHSDGYRFQEWENGAWKPVNGAPLAQRHDLARGATLSGADSVSSGTFHIAPDLLPDKDGIKELWLGKGTVRRAVVFDGATAGVAP